MVTNYATHLPGDFILDRYMPDATAEEREIARENLRAFALVVVGIANRLALEEHEQAVRTKADSTLEFPQRHTPHL